MEDVMALIAGPDPVSAKAIEAAVDLKIIARFGVGVENVDIEAATRRRVIVTNAVGANADAVADYVFCARHRSSSPKESGNPCGESRSIRRLQESSGQATSEKG